MIWIYDTELVELPLAWIELWASLCLSIYLVYATISLRDPIYKELKGYINCKYLIAGWTIASFLVHPGDRSSYFFSIQMFVAFTIYLEAVALIPQLYHLKRDGDVAGLTSNYLFWLATSRAIRLIFWTIMWHRGDMFFMLMLADLLHCLLLANFVTKYLQSLHSGTPILIMSSRKQAID